MAEGPLPVRAEAPLAEAVLTTVLVVDDEPHNRALRRDYVEAFLAGNLGP